MKNMDRCRYSFEGFEKDQAPGLDYINSPMMQQVNKADPSDGRIHRGLGARNNKLYLTSCRRRITMQAERVPWQRYVEHDHGQARKILRMREDGKAL